MTDYQRKRLRRLRVMVAADRTLLSGPLYRVSADAVRRHLDEVLRELAQLESEINRGERR